MSVIEVGNHSLPVPTYPFPDQLPLFTDEVENEVTRWLETDFSFLSDEALSKYQAMKLGHAAARCYGTVVSKERLVPCARTFVMATVFDDYYEPCYAEELDRPLLRSIDILCGEKPNQSDNGIMRSLAILREEFLSFANHEWMDRFISSWRRYVAGIRAEAPYKQAGRCPSVRNLLDIRTASLGIVPCTELVDITMNWFPPLLVAHHPAIDQLRWLTSRIMAIQNDLYSLPKEIVRDSEVINLVLAVQRENALPLSEAYQRSLAIHDEILTNFLDRLAKLPDFNVDQDLIYEYVGNFGIMIQGCKSWYEKDTHRYCAGAAGYAPSEYIPSQGVIAGSDIM